MLAWWVSELWERNPAMLVSWAYWVIFAIVLHELAHGWAALACGDRTPVEAGHMTWNPLVHMGPFSLIMFVMVGIAWGMMPVDPSRFRRRFDDAVVSAAGPLMNLLLAGASLLGYAGWIAFARGNVSPVLFENGANFLRLGLMLNLVLCVFNLLPVPPLDGSRIVASFVPRYRRFLESEHGQNVAIIALILLFLFAGKPVFRVAAEVAGIALGVVDGLLSPSTP